MPMRVPITELPTQATRPLGLPNENQPADQSAGAMAQGLGAMGGALTRSAAVAGAAVAAAAAKAHAIAEADALAELQKKTTEDLYKSVDADPLEPGQYGPEAPVPFMATRGEAAFAASEPTLKGIDDFRVKLAERFSSEEAKASFLAKSRSMLEQTRRQVEGHASGQLQVAADATTKSLASSAFDAVAGDPTNNELAETQVQIVEPALRRMSLSKEDGDRRMSDFVQGLAETRLQQVVARGDWKAAEDILSLYKDDLGNSSKYVKAVEAMKLEAEAQRAGADIIAKATPEEGPVSRTEVDRLLLEVDPGRQKQVAQFVEHRLLFEDKVWKEKKAQRFDEARLVLAKTGYLANANPLTLQWMEEHDKEGLAQLLEREKSLRLAEQSRARGEAARDTTDQATALIAVQNDIRLNPDKYFGMEPKEFERLWSTKLSESGYAKAGALFSSTIGNIDKVGLSEFTTSLRKDVASDPRLKKKSDAAIYVESMSKRYEAKQKEVKRRLTLDEIDEIRKSAFVDIVQSRSIKTPVGEIPLPDSHTPSYKVKPTSDGTATPGEPKKQPGRYKHPNGKFFRVFPDGTWKWETP